MLYPNFLFYFRKNKDKIDKKEEKGKLQTNQKTKSSFSLKEKKN